MKRILVLSNMYPSKKYPHYGVFVQNTIDILNSGGYQTSVCSVAKHDNLMLRLFAYGFAYLKCVFLGIFGKYDCLYAHFVSHTAIPARILKIIHPSLYLVENAHGNDVIAQTEEDTGKNIERSRKILPLANKVIVPSCYFKKVISMTYNYPENQIFVSPSGGVNMDILYPLDQQIARKKCRLELGAYYLGYIGRITAGKGWNTFLSAIERVYQSNKIANLRILIVGSGDQEKNLNREIEKLKLKDIVTHREFVQQKDLIYYYNSLNVFVFPSESKSESLGLVGLEAMACGTFCIFSNNFGITTYATDNVDCLMFNKTNVEQLSEKIEDAYFMSQEKRKKIINNAIETASMYEQKNISKEFIQFFDEILN